MHNKVNNIFKLYLSFHFFMLAIRIMTVLCRNTNDIEKFAPYNIYIFHNKDFIVKI